MKTDWKQKAMQAAANLRHAKCSVPFTQEEWHLWENADEEYVVPLIKKYLRTEQHRVMMNELDITIEDMLNGRVEGEEKQAFVHELFTVWNLKLGYKHFNV